MSQLAGLDLRKAFTKRANRAHLLEYWSETYRTAAPQSGVVPHVWKWTEVKPLIVEARNLVGVQEAERRALVLSNPGLEGMPYMTNTIFGDVQLLSPGETAPAHRHTTSASRFVLEGSGSYTVVAGEKCTMLPGDLIINPAWQWHDFGNQGTDDALWLDVLDVPLATALGAVFYDYDYAKEGDRDKSFQTIRKDLNGSSDLYARSGILPKFLPRTGKPYSPQLVYRWEDAHAAMNRLKDHEGSPYDGIIVEYTNPETGQSVMPTMSFNMQMLRPGEHTLSHRQTASTAYCVVEGCGYTQVGDTRLHWEKNDVFVVPSWAWHEHVNLAPLREAYLLSVTDMPTMQKLGLYREEGRTKSGDIVRVAE